MHMCLDRQNRWYFGAVAQALVETKSARISWFGELVMEATDEMVATAVRRKVGALR